MRRCRAPLPSAASTRCWSRGASLKSLPREAGEGGLGGLRPPSLASRTPTQSVGYASVARRVGWGVLLIARHSKLGPPPRLASLAGPPPPPATGSYQIPKK